MGLRKKKSLIDQAAEYVESVKPHVESAVTTAKDKALPLFADARDKAAPMIAEGAARAADRAALSATIAAEKAAIGRELAAAKVAELKGEAPKKKGSKLKKLFLIGTLAAIGAAVFKKVKGDQASDNWQSSYVPTPPPPAPVPDPADSTDDSGGSSPDEAMSDASDEPHAATTPDQPVETVTIDEDAANKG